MIHNKTGYNNAETFGRLILPFWFKDKPNPDHILITMDGAGCHKINNILDYAADELGSRDHIPQECLIGVANTTFCTQPCDMGIIKDFKNIYRKMTLERKVFSGV